MINANTLARTSASSLAVALLLRLTLRATQIVNAGADRLDDDAVQWTAIGPLSADRDQKLTLLRKADATFPRFFIFSGTHSDFITCASNFHLGLEGKTEIALRIGS